MESEADDVCFPWQLALWTMLFSAAVYGLYALKARHFVSEPHLILLLFVLVPVAIFLLSGSGQAVDDRDGDEPEDEILEH